MIETARSVLASDTSLVVDAHATGTSGLLIWAFGIGFIVVGDISDAWTGMGAVVVIASGLYIFRKN